MRLTLARNGNRVSSKMGLPFRAQLPGFIQILELNTLSARMLDMPNSQNKKHIQASWSVAMIAPRKLLRAILPLALCLSPAAAQTVTSTLSVGASPGSVAVNPVTNKIYVANVSNASLSVINGATNTIYSIAVGANPVAIAVNTLTNKIYTANLSDSTVSIVDGATGATTTLAVATSPTAIAVNPLTNRIYVVSEGAAPCYNGSLTVIDGGTNSTTTISVGTLPQAVAVNPVTNQIYVGGSSGLTIMDGQTNTTNTVAAGIPVQIVAVNPVTNKIFTTSFAANALMIIDGQTNNTTSVGVGANPQAIAVNPVTNKIYVANYLDGSVSVVDGATQSASTISVGLGPDAIGLDTLTNQVYVASASSNTVTIIDGATNIPTSVAVGVAPSAVGVNPVTNKIYVAIAGNNTVAVFDGATNTTSSVSVGTNPQAAAVNPVANKVYVANGSSNTLTVFDGATNTTSTVATGINPQAIVANWMTNKIYVANQGSSTVTVVDGNTNNATTIPVGNGPNSIALDPVTNKIYICNGLDNSVTVLDGATNNTTTVAVGTAPSAIVVNPVTGLIYVVNSGANSVTVVDGSTNNALTVPVGSNPAGVAVNPATNKIYVANSNGFSVTVIDGNMNTTSVVSAGDTPIAVAVNPVTNKIYVANNGSNNISVIDGATSHTTTVSVGQGPTAIAVNQVTNKVYITNGNGANVTIVDGATLATSTVSTGSQPTGVSVNPFTNQIYVVNAGSNSISVIQEEPFSQISLTVGVNPLPGNASTSASVQFTFAANDTTSGAGIDGVLYQIDTWQAPWSQASSQGSGNFTGSTASLRPGLHVVYAYSTDGQEAGSGNPGYGSSSLISNIVAYAFLIQSPLQITPLDLNFGQQTLGTSSPSQTITLTNGGGPLSISYVTTVGPFAQTNDCGSALGTMASCSISVNFSPVVAGTTDGALIIADGAPGGGQVMPLSGIGMPVPSTTTLNTSANPITSGQSATFTANVTAHGGTPTGTATFLDGGVSLGVVTLDQSGNAQFTATNLSAGMHTITASYSGNTVFSGSVSSALSESVFGKVVLNMAAAGSSVVFNSLADDAVNSPSICGTNHWTKTLGGQMHDNRSGLHGLTINNEIADVWVTWDGASDGSTASIGCVFVAVDSVVAMRGYMAVPRASVYISNGLSNSPGDGLLPWLGADSPLPLSLFDAINGSTMPGSPGTTLSMVFSEIRPEDAQFATARALSKLSSTRSGLGYGDWANPTTFGSSVIGTPIASSYSSALSIPCDFGIAPLGSDPISGSRPARWETYPVGVVPVLILVSNEDNSSTGLGQGLSPGLTGPGPWTAGPYVATNLTRFTAAYLFSGSLTRTIDALPDGTSLAQNCSGTSCGLTQLQREPIGGAFNVFEYSLTRSHAAQTSQEDGVVPGAMNMNPLNIVMTSGGTRLRVLGPSEMINAVCGSSCINPPTGIAPTTNRIGYSFWGYSNLKPLAGVHGSGTGGVYATAPPKGHYLLMDSVDGLFGQPGDNPDGALNPPVCPQAPCPKIPFTHLIDGSYPLWNIVRAVVDSSHFRGDGTPIDTLLANLPASATKFSDYLTMDQMHVFRSHRDADVAGLDARNGNGCAFGYGTEVGQDMGGAIFTIQSDLNYAFDTTGSSNTCLGSSPPDTGLVNTVQ